MIPLDAFLVFLVAASLPVIWLMIMRHYLDEGKDQPTVQPSKPEEEAVRHHHTHGVLHHA